MKEIATDLRVLLLALARSKTVWIAAVFFSAYILMAVYIDRETLALAMSGVLLSVAIGVLATYGHAILDALKKDKPNHVDYLVMGIGLSWLAIGYNRAWGLTFRWLDRPTWMNDHWSLSLFLFAAVLAGTLHITAPGAVDGRIPKRNWVRWGLAVAVGLSVVYLASMAFPDPI
jgi:H+/Cl- antiporter ClcA